MSEADHQAALFEWAQVQVNLGRYPELARLLHIPNGEKRDKVTAARLKAMGVRAGVPDVLLPVARGKYHCLWVELKSDGGRASADQMAWHAWLIRHGQKVHICYDWEEAARLIVEYLNLKDDWT